MDRPEKRNALSEAHMLELIDCLRSIAASDAAVVILAGGGPAFCSGHDLSEMVDRTPAYYHHLFAVCTDLMETVQSIPQPQAYGYAQEVMSLNALAADAGEGICAFLEKRPAKWQGR